MTIKIRSIPMMMIKRKIIKKMASKNFSGNIKAILTIKTIRTTIKTIFSIIEDGFSLL